MIITFEQIKPFVDFREKYTEGFKDMLAEDYNDPELNEWANAISEKTTQLELEYSKDRKERYNKLREMCGKYYLMTNIYESNNTEYSEQHYILLYDVLDTNHMMFYVEANNTNYEGGLSHKSMRWDNWKGTTSFDEITEEDFMLIAKDACENVLEVRKEKMANPRPQHKIKLGI